MRLSVGDAPREIRAAVLAVKTADREIRNDLNRRTRAEFKPVWTQSLTSKVSGQDPRFNLLPAGAKIQAGNPPSFVTASTKKKVGGLVAVENWAGFEYGANKAAVSQYERSSPLGRTHKVRRRVQTGHPKRLRKGRVIGPAVQELLPRLASLWVQTVIKTYLDAMEGK